MFALYHKKWTKIIKFSNGSSSFLGQLFQEATSMTVCPKQRSFRWYQWLGGKVDPGKSYSHLKISLLHKNGVSYEFGANLAIFKKSKNGLKSHKSNNHLTSRFTKVQKLGLGWSNFKFTIFVSPYASPLCLFPTLSHSIVIAIR